MRCNIGFLDGTTNNVILDCVLTDLGRQLLARNDGSFAIKKFALGDDEVNYLVVSKYGRTVGRDKVEKNTPVFEAMTNQTHALKYKLISVSNPNLIYIPHLSLTNGGTSGVVLLSTSGTGGGVNTQVLTIQQSIQSGTVIDNELRDQTFQVELPNLFLQVSNSTPTSVDGQQRAIYMLARSSTANATTQGSTLSLTIALKSFSASLFAVYGSAPSKTLIKTSVRVIGMQSGAVIDIPVEISNS